MTDETPKPITWKCDQCGALEELKQGDDPSPTHKDCGGTWTVYVSTTPDEARMVNQTIA
jgi:hypothetical protein